MAFLQAIFIAFALGLCALAILAAILSLVVWVSYSITGGSGFDIVLFYFGLNGLLVAVPSIVFIIAYRYLKKISNAT